MNKFIGNKKEGKNSLSFLDLNKNENVISIINKFTFHLRRQIIGYSGLTI